MGFEAGGGSSSNERYRTNEAGESSADAADRSPDGRLSRRSFLGTSAAVTAGVLGTVGLSGTAAADEGIVNDYGRLQVQDGHVCAEDGRQVTLGGMSFFWSNWAPSYYTASQVDYLVDDFQVDVVRAACAVGEEGSYQQNPQANRERVEAVVDRAIERDVYAIIDWHLEGDVSPYADDAEQFFSEMAQQYGDDPHVIFEPYNEPTEQSPRMIRDYCQRIADVIREQGSDNLVVCGSDTWSQNPQSYSIDDPNAAYSFHAYPDAEYGDAHMSAFESNVPAAMNQGNAVFVTEFGAQYGDHDRTQQFIDRCQEMNISMCAWSVNDKEEPWSIYTSGTDGLTEIGQYYREQFRNWPSSDGSEDPDTTPSPPEVDGATPTDPDDDGDYEDLNGNERIDYNDVVQYYNHREDPVLTDNVEYFDYNDNDRIDYNDVVELYSER